MGKISFQAWKTLIFLLARLVSFCYFQFKIFQVLSYTLFYWCDYHRTVINFLCSVLHNTCIIFIDLKCEKSQVLSSPLFTCGFSQCLKMQSVKRKSPDYFLFPHQVHQPKIVEAKLSKPSILKYKEKVLIIYFYPLRYMNIKVGTQK